MDDCPFCKIVRGEAPANRIWEDEQHLAFLSIFPNTQGFSVVITRQHYPSYAFDLPDDVLCGLVLAARQVGRTGMIFEGFGVNHVHAKLVPMHGTKLAPWRPLSARHDTYFERYEGYLSSHDCERASDGELEKLALQIRS